MGRIHEEERGKDGGSAGDHRNNTDSYMMTTIMAGGRSRPESLSRVDDDTNENVQALDGQREEFRRKEGLLGEDGNEKVEGEKQEWRR